MQLQPLSLKLACISCLLAFIAASVGAEEAQRPNIIVILVDDMGFSDVGCYGGEIETPNIDFLASGGLRFTQFYNSGRCCPTRASLMTGLHPHQVGIGHMTEPPERTLGFEGPYQGYLNDNCVTLAEVLRAQGYQTLMTGKWHLGYHRKSTWPTQRGFDRYYGCISGACNYFKPGGNRGIVEGNEAVETDEDFYATDTFTDKACEYISACDKTRPFFLYLAYNAPHWPLNAKWDDFQKYQGKYRGGWEPLMRKRLAKQIAMGMFPKTISPAPHEGPEWDELRPGQRDDLDSIMAAYAGCIDSIDQNVGKLVHHLKAREQFENTLILFLSDNGACQEGGILGKGSAKMIKNPPLETTGGVRLGQAWANACNTPFRRYKHFVHEGGACTPLIAHWPAGIPQKDRGGYVRQHAYLQDVMATFVDICGGGYPSNKPSCVGESFLPLLRGGRDEIHTKPIFWEHEGNAAMRDGKWKLVRAYEKPWELYDLSTDRAEMTNLARSHAEKRRELVRRWEQWATATQVAFPQRFNMYEFLRKQKKPQKERKSK